MVNQIYTENDKNFNRINMHPTNNSQFSYSRISGQEGDSHILDNNNQASNFTNYINDSTDTNADGKPKILKVVLEDSNLWQMFTRHVNEMIVTRGGRRLFPVYKVKVEGLESNEMYKFELDFQLVESFRWKYVGGEWLKSSRSDVLCVSGVYTHPDSPNYGKFWMHTVVSFSRAKITNREQTSCEAIFLHSMYKYNPRLIIKHIDRQTKTEVTIGTFQFQETEFIAVTAYQNEQVTKLKVKNNPFAKAFHDQRKSTFSYISKPNSNKKEETRSYEQNSNGFANYGVGLSVVTASNSIYQPSIFENMQKGYRNGTQPMSLSPPFQNTMPQPPDTSYSYMQPLGMNNNYSIYPITYSDRMIQPYYDRPFYPNEIMPTPTSVPRSNQIYYQHPNISYNTEPEVNDEEINPNPLSMLAIVASQERLEKRLKY